MGKPSDKEIQAWLTAAGKSDKDSKKIVDRVVDTAQFIKNTLQLKPTSCLSGIDFSKPIKKLASLPNGVYVQYNRGRLGNWFTYTNLSADDVGLAAGKRKRMLYSPSSSVPALLSTAKSVKDTWTPNRLFSSLDPSDPKVQALLIKAMKKPAVAALPPEQRDKFFKELVKKVEGRMGQMTKGGGAQYLVGNISGMKAVSTLVDK